MKHRLATIIGLAALGLFILFIFHLTDIIPSRQGGRWESDGGDGQRYVLELTSDSLLTTAGLEGGLLTFTPDTLESRMLAISIGATRVASSSSLFDAVWDYAWYRLMTDPRLSLETLYLTLPAIPYGPEAAETLLRSFSPESARRRRWPLGNMETLLWITASADYALTSGNDTFGRYAAARCAAALEADSTRLYEMSTGLWRGGGDGVYSGSLPGWLTGADRHNLSSLALNAAAADAYYKVSELAGMTGDRALEAQMKSSGEHLSADIARHLWLPVEGRFSQYLYGRLALNESPVSTGFGNALAASSGAVTDLDMARRIVERMPRSPYGIPSTFPTVEASAQGEDSPAAQSLWANACRRSDDFRALWNALASLMRLVCLDASASAGQEGGMEGCAAFVGTVVRSIMGMRAESEALVINPFIPVELGNELRVTGMAYRETILDIAVIGNGSSIASMTIDGASQPDHRVPGNLKGRHKVRIEMVAPALGENNIEEKEIVTPAQLPKAYPEPEMEWPDSLSAPKVSEPLTVALMVNGERLENVSGAEISIPKKRGYRETLIFPVDDRGRISGYSSRPYADYFPGSSTLVQAEWFKARELARDIYRRMYRTWLKLKSRGKASDAERPNRRLTQIVALPEDETLTFIVEADKTADCVVEVGYTQGRDSGPRGTPLRAMAVNGFHHTVIAMPRTKAGGDTTLTVTTLPTIVTLREGPNEITLHSRPSERKPGARPDTVMIDYLRITPL